MKPANLKPRKIVLRQQTLRVLSSRQLTAAVGGVPVKEETLTDSMDDHCTASAQIRCLA